MVTEFTPVASALGGLMIGGSAVLLMLVLGRIMGATGILAGIIAPTSKEEFVWRVALLLGMVSGPAAALLFTGALPTIVVPGSTIMLALGGFLVGVGVTLGGGCTSGHGVCGIARLSQRSLVATMVFMVTTALTVYLIRHIWGFY